MCYHPQSQLKFWICGLILLITCNHDLRCDRFVLRMNGFEKVLQIDETYSNWCIIKSYKMLDSFQNNLIVLIIHITIASEKKNFELAI